MAGQIPEVLDKVLPNIRNERSSSVECAVCLQTCIHPAELPCGHIFCYLCIKGIVNQGRPCAMCRQDIPLDYLYKPKLLNTLESETNNRGFEDGHLWFYEGRNGWWQYDERTNLELESAYQKGERWCELLIAGFLYVADFGEMLQYRRDAPSKRRRIKRDLATTEKKGVAGLKTTKFNNTVSSNSTAIRSNEMTQSWSLSNATTTLDSRPVATYTPSISNTITEPVFNNQQPGDRISFGLSNVACNINHLMDCSPRSERSATQSGNFNLDNITGTSMDLTVEQIESLNSELINDFEVLFRDVNNYGQSQSNINQCRSERVVDNYITQYLNRACTLRDSSQNESETTSRGSNFSELSENSGSEPSSVSATEEFPVLEEQFEK